MERQTSEQTFLGHPKGLFYLFATEFWERFSYYGMRSLLVLYIIDQFFQDINATDRKPIAYGIYGAYGALVYATPVIGGIIADKYLGYRRSIMVGAVLMSLGHLFMALPGNDFFYTALGLLIVGNGFFKPNISSLLGTLYSEGDKRRDSGFTIFYMGINLGAFLSMILCPLLKNHYGWHYGFGLAGFGMLSGLLVFIYADKKQLLGNYGYAPDIDKAFGVIRKDYLVVLFAIASVFLFSFLVKNNEYTIGSFGLMSLILSVLGTIVLFIIGYNMYQSSRVEASRLFVLVILTFISIMFWAFFEQAGTSLTIFANENVILPAWCDAEQAQSINPLVIIIFAIPFALMWPKLGERNLNPNSILKTFIGLLLLGVGFLVFAYSARFMNGDAKVPFFYLSAGYFVLTIGELCLSPTILSKTTELAPAKMVGFMMGATLLSSSFAHHIGALIAKLTVPSSNAQTQEGWLHNMAVSITGFNNEALQTSAGNIKSLAMSTMVFAQIGIVAIIVSLILLIFSPFIKKMMHGVH